MPEEDVDVIDPLGVADITREQRNQLLARVLDDHPELAEFAARHGHPTPLELDSTK